MTILIRTVLILFIQFISIGPTFAQAIWSQYSGPFSGEISAFARHGDTIFAGSRLTGLFRSTDGGRHWTATLPELTYVHSLYNSDTSLLIGTDKLYSYANEKLVQLGEPVSGAIDYMHALNGKLFLSSGYGVYMYMPTSNELVLKNNGLESEAAIFWTRGLASINGVLFCNVLKEFGGDLYKSIDEGDNWEKVTVSTYSSAFSSVKSYNDSLLCGGFNGSLLLSTDEGNTWTNLQFNLDYSAINTIEFVGNDLFVSTNNGAYKLKQGETEWYQVSDRVFDNTLRYHDVFLASDRGGVYRQEAEGSNFVLSNNGINTSRVNGIELFDRKIYSATERGLHFTSTDGDEWSVVTELVDVYTKAIAKSDTVLFAGTSQGLYRTLKGSTFWSLCENGISDEAIWDIRIATNKVYVATDDGVYVSLNNGNSWRLLSNSRSLINQMTYLGVTDSVLVAGNSSGLYKILPDSSDWERVAFFGDNEIFSINTIDEDIYISTMNSSIYKSSDYGTTWAVVNIPVTSNIDMIKRGDNIYAASYNKIYYSSDDGTSWNFWSETGTSEIILTCITEGDSAFYAGTYGKSIWRRTFLSEANVSSDVYTIVGDSIYNVSLQTTATDFKSNVTLSYGSSLELNPQQSSSNGRSGQTALIKHGDEVRIIAENGKNQKVFKISNLSFVTSISDAEDRELKLYPVPTKDVLNIYNAGRIESYSIVNSLGEKLLGKPLQNESIDVSSLPRGLYFLTVIDDSARKRIIKFVKE